jgi:hypothetical protein
MRFRSTVDHELSFELGGKTYTVAPQGSVTIPERVAYAVSSRGLPLKAEAGQEDAPEAPQQRDEPSTEEGRVWASRAVAQRQAKEEVQQALADSRAEVEQLHEQARVASLQVDTFAAELRDALSIGAGDSILAAVEQLQEQLAAVTAERDQLLEAPPAPPAAPEAPVAPTEGSAPAEGPKPGANATPPRKPR